MTDDEKIRRLISTFQETSKVQNDIIEFIQTILDRRERLKKKKYRIIIE
jgi:hypothetical protein